MSIEPEKNIVHINNSPFDKLQKSQLWFLKH